MSDPNEEIDTLEARYEAMGSAVGVVVLQNLIIQQAGDIKHWTHSALRHSKLKVHIDLIWEHIKTLDDKIEAPKKNEWSELILDITVDFIFGKAITLGVKAFSKSLNKQFKKYFDRKSKSLKIEPHEISANEIILDNIYGKSEENQTNAHRNRTEKLLNYLYDKPKTEGESSYERAEEYAGEVLDETYDFVKLAIKNNRLKKPKNEESGATVTADLLNSYDAIVDIIGSDLDAAFGAFSIKIKKTKVIYDLVVEYIPIQKNYFDETTVTDNFIDEYTKFLLGYNKSVIHTGMTIESTDISIRKVTEYTGLFASENESIANYLGGVRGTGRWMHKGTKYIDNHDTFTNVAVRHFKVISSLKLKTKIFKELSEKAKWWAAQQTKDGTGRYSLVLHAVRIHISGRDKVAIVLQQKISIGDQLVRHYVFLHWVEHPMFEDLALSKYHETDPFAEELIGYIEGDGYGPHIRTGYSP